MLILSILQKQDGCVKEKS